MNHPQVMQALKRMYQDDPAGYGVGWTGTDDIEQAVYWAGRIGKGQLEAHVITYTPGPGFQVRRNTD